MTGYSEVCMCGRIGSKMTLDQARERHPGLEIPDLPPGYETWEVVTERPENWSGIAVHISMPRAWFPASTIACERNVSMYTGHPAGEGRILTAPKNIAAFAIPPTPRLVG